MRRRWRERRMWSKKGGGRGEKRTVKGEEFEKVEKMEEEKKAE